MQTFGAKRRPIIAISGFMKIFLRATGGQSKLDYKIQVLATAPQTPKLIRNYHHPSILQAPSSRHLRCQPGGHHGNPSITQRVINSLSIHQLRRLYSETSHHDNQSSDDVERNQPDGKEGFYDIIIAGGGMTGRAMACALGLEPSLDHFKILMIEAAPTTQPLPDELPDIYSNRVCALNQGSVDLLDSIGAWPHMVNHRVQPIRSMQVWDASSEATITFRDNLPANQELGFIVENSVTVDALSRQLKALGDKVTVVYENKVEDIKVPDQGVTKQETWVQVKLEDGNHVKTRLLIGADGTNSVVRKLCKIPYTQWEYDQCAVVATLHLSEPTENVVAWQRFLPSGPVALLPLTNELSSLVWSTNPSAAEGLLSMSAEQFVDEVNNAFWDDRYRNPVATNSGRTLNHLLNLVQPDGPSVRQMPPSVSSVTPESRASFPLSMGHASYYVKPRIALIGDAAHRVHPLAGQGVNLGLADVACLRDTLVSAAAIGRDLGSLSHLHTYETTRQRQVVPVMSVIEGLKHLYTTDNAAVVLARTLGLQVTNAIEPLKQQIINMATGR